MAYTEGDRIRPLDYTENGAAGNGTMSVETVRAGLAERTRKMSASLEELRARAIDPAQ